MREPPPGDSDIGAPPQNFQMRSAWPVRKPHRGANGYGGGLGGDAVQRPGAASVPVYPGFSWSILVFPGFSRSIPVYSGFPRSIPVHSGPFRSIRVGRGRKPSSKTRPGMGRPGRMGTRPAPVRVSALLGNIVDIPLHIEFVPRNANPRRPRAIALGNFAEAGRRYAHAPFRALTPPPPPPSGGGRVKTESEPRLPCRRSASRAASREESGGLPGGPPARGSDPPHRLRLSRARGVTGSRQSRSCRNRSARTDDNRPPPRSPRRSSRRALRVRTIRDTARGCNSR